MQTLTFLRVCINIVWAIETPIVICFYFLQNQWSNVNIVFKGNNDVK